MHRSSGSKVCLCSVHAEGLAYTCAGTVTRMQLIAMTVCLEAVQATESIPEQEVIRIQKKLTVLGILRRLHSYLAQV